MSLFGLVFIICRSSSGQSSNIWKFAFLVIFDLEIFVLFGLISDFPEWFYDVTDPDTSHLIFEYDSRDIKRHLIVFKYAVWLYLIADSPKTNNSFFDKSILTNSWPRTLTSNPGISRFWPSREIITGKTDFSYLCLPHLYDLKVFADFSINWAFYPSGYHSHFKILFGFYFLN